jgi:hypothetical protein
MVNKADGRRPDGESTARPRAWSPSLFLLARFIQSLLHFPFFSLADTTSVLIPLPSICL